MARLEQIIPYCGMPPLPDALWSRWNFDPGLIAILVGILLCYLIGELRMPAVKFATGRRWAERSYFGLGWAVAAGSLLSPICALSVALFSARVGQHMILTMIAAPLVAAGRPLPRFAMLLPLRARRRFVAGIEFLAGKVISAVLFAVCLWIWHIPVFYGMALRSDVAYFTMQATLFAGGFLLWHGILVRGLEQPLLSVASGFATTLQMSLLGALLTFASRPVFLDHLTTTGAWNLSPLEDQQLGGLIMWIPGCAILVLASLLLIAQLLRSLREREGQLSPDPAS